MTDEKKSVAQEYIDVITQKVKAAQETGDIPGSYAFELGKKKVTMCLPRSVMAQKHMVHVRNNYLQTNSFEDEELLINMIVSNTTVDGHQVSVNDFDFSELEVLKTAYMDELLLPLSLGGDKAVGTYMGQVLGKGPKA